MSDDDKICLACGMRGGCPDCGNKDASEKLLAIAAVFNHYWNGDDRTGDDARDALDAIGKILGPPF